MFIYNMPFRAIVSNVITVFKWALLSFLPAAMAQIQENGAQTEYFEYAMVDGGAWLIAGLTEGGSTQTRLLVPASYGGKPVIGFTADALTGADQLAELCLPESIESLPDDLFRETGNLTRLVLEHTQSVCSVGADTFRGADQIQIYVPGSVYPMIGTATAVKTTSGSRTWTGSIPWADMKTGCKLFVYSRGVVG